MTDGYRCVMSRPTQAFLGTERKFPKYTGGGKPGCSGFVNMSSKNCFVNWTFQEIEKLQTKMKRGIAGFIFGQEYGIRETRLLEVAMPILEKLWCVVPSLELIDVDTKRDGRGKPRLPFETATCFEKVTIKTVH